jgi:isopropylmalate/homocitrate/citramalate synthase
MPDRSIIFNATPRRGEKAQGCSPNAGRKLRLASQLERLVVDVINVARDRVSPAVRLFSARPYLAQSPVLVIIVSLILLRSSG